MVRALFMAREQAGLGPQFPNAQLHDRIFCILLMLNEINPVKPIYFPPIKPPN
ncbi:hypothetical protein [Paraburkholderia sp. CNPSo 3281]|uniref:hypothetical protein n=1 Tax=Paraburkholderia sp. CNPSo 3281 TaxID=2940933 RepID=UPI0020B63CE5|nr:hypothetical protein [Paraburkholderia sp. CNPSo 3281]MCP3719987.1 hypothetical protein [Paraburkholderia sp. CNPSo 3281]